MGWSVLSDGPATHSTDAPCAVARTHEVPLVCVLQRFVTMDVDGTDDRWRTLVAI